MSPTRSVLYNSNRCLLQCQWSDTGTVLLLLGLYLRSVSTKLPFEHKHKQCLSAGYRLWVDLGDEHRVRALSNGTKPHVGNRGGFCGVYKLSAPRPLMDAIWISRLRQGAHIENSRANALPRQTPSAEAAFKPRCYHPLCFGY